MKSANKTSVKIIFIVCLVIVFGASLSVGLKIKDNPKTYTYAQNSKEVLSASTTADSNVEINVIKTDTNFATNGLGSGMKKVSVSFELKNNQDKVLEFSPGLNLKLIDSSGNKHEPTMKFADPNVVIGGPILPSQTGNYTVDFEVPIDSNLSSLSYQKIN